MAIKFLKKIAAKLNLSSKPPIVENLENVRISEGVIADNCTFEENISIGRNSYLYQTQIGRYTYLAQSASIMNTKIGSFCSIAQNVLIGGGMHPSNTFASTSPVFYSLNKQCGKTFADKSYFREMGNVVIGNDVWIGANVVIMDDVTIGDGAIIGAGAIVTKDIEPYSIVVGTPAKHLKYRFETEQIDFLLEFKWWLKDEAWLTENYKDLHNIISLVEKYKIDK